MNITCIMTHHIWKKLGHIDNCHCGLMVQDIRCTRYRCIRCGKENEYYS